MPALLGSASGSECEMAGKARDLPETRPFIMLSEPLPITGPSTAAVVKRRCVSSTYDHEVEMERKNQ